MEESTVWFFVVIQFLIICLCAYAVLKLCGLIKCVNWIRNMLRKQEPATNVNTNASTSNFNKTASTEQSMISMQQHHHPNYGYQVPIVLPYPMYQLQQFQGESQGQDMTCLSVQPPVTPKLPPQSPYKAVTPKLPEQAVVPTQNSYPLGFCISSTAVTTEEKKNESETKI